MGNVVVDKNKCIGCGMCQKDCVSSDIEMNENKACPRNLSCIECGHCEAICPVGAIKLVGYDDEVIEFDNDTRLNPDVLMNAIRTRRTIRTFEDKEVPEKIVDMILEAGRLAPTGGNGQRTSFVILKDKKSECEAIAVKKFRNLFKVGKAFVSYLKSMEIDDNFFFKKAPLVLVVVGKDKVSASLAAENMAFMAEANGLGVLFSGFYSTAANQSNKIKKLMGLTNKDKVVTTLVIGYPKYRYHRTVHRKALKVIKA